ncbi:MAG: PduL/EutD family phosphate acyltransferase [[Clostridium] leptum]
MKEGFSVEFSKKKYNKISQLFLMKWEMFDSENMVERLPYSLTQQDLDTLFGPEYELTPKKSLSQPGQFACVEKVEVVGPKGSIKLSILGPVRKRTQIELSKTDARSIGIDAPLRLSGDIDGTPGCKVIGPKGAIELAAGVIVASATRICAGTGGGYGAPMVAS